jgi:hydroxymethylpyrimidine pyrophosphatase-like HAD family hydrolase
MTFVIDIDDTLIYSEKIQCKDCNRINYKTINIDYKEIDIINKLYEKGNTIILYTGRGWDSYQLTKKQLKEANVKFHELVMGKPQGTYIDKDSYKSLEEYFVSNK